MSRKIEMMKASMGRDGERRRSPRISALDEKKEEQRQLSSRTRANSNRIKRKFNDAAFTSRVSKLSKQVWKGRDSPQNADNSTDFVEWRSRRDESQKTVNENQKRDNYGKASIMPAKHILELVLDTLQRRDTYEIFAEPVDPDEVEDYYEIIKEPMDFATMRAKLHEGMYKNLQQFEHDVFLIPENAMYFNSSATIYFRQARAIHDLAKKVFHVLKRDPENFVSEFSGTRRRSMRKALSSTKDDGLVGSDFPCKPSTSTFRRNNKKNPGRFYARRTGGSGRDGKLSTCEVSDRRSTYWAWKSSLHNQDDKDPMFPSSYKTLVLMNEGDISYKDSLMSFIKDLGPMAQMVAKRKLLGQHGSNGGISSTTKTKVVAAASLDVNAFRTFRDFAPASNPFLKATRIIDLTGEANGRNTTASGTPGKEKTACGTPPGKERMISIPPSCVTLKTGRGSLLINVDGANRNSATRDLNYSSSRRSFRDNDNARGVILALENSHSHSNNVAEFKLRKKKSSIVPLTEKQKQHGPDSLSEAAATTTTVACAVSSLTLARPLPSTSQFTYDLPFLKARLNQMNVVSENIIGGEFLKKRALNCTRQADSEGIIIKHFPYNQSSSPRPSLDYNLALHF